MEQDKDNKKNINRMQKQGDQNDDDETFIDLKTIYVNFLLFLATEYIFSPFLSHCFFCFSRVLVLHILLCVPFFFCYCLASDCNYFFV